MDTELLDADAADDRDIEAAEEHSELAEQGKLLPFSTHLQATRAAQIASAAGTTTDSEDSEPRRLRRRTRDPAAEVGTTGAPADPEGGKFGDPERDTALLGAAEKLWLCVGTATGAFAALVEYICRRKLYLQSGYTSRADYATRALGIQTCTLKSWISAGLTAWRFYEQDCRDLLRQLRGGAIRIDLLPAMPHNSNLLLMGRVARAIDRNAGKPPSQRAADKRALADDVRAGIYTTAALKGILAKEKKPQHAVGEDQADVAAPQIRNPYINLLPDDIAGPLQQTHALEEALLRRSVGGLDGDALDLIDSRARAIMAAAERLRKPQSSSVDGEPSQATLSSGEGRQ